MLVLATASAAKTPAHAIPTSQADSEANQGHGLLLYALIQAVTLGIGVHHQLEPLWNLQRAKGWLGGLDSNQDKQIQNLLYCQLYDLPTR